MPAVCEGCRSRLLTSVSRTELKCMDFVVFGSVFWNALRLSEQHRLPLNFKSLRDSKYSLWRPGFYAHVFARLSDLVLGWEIGHVCWATTFWIKAWGIVWRTCFPSRNISISELKIPKIQWLLWMEPCQTECWGSNQGSGGGKVKQREPWKIWDQISGLGGSIQVGGDQQGSCREDLYSDT